MAQLFNILQEARNIALRKIAISKGLRLNEWGIYDKHNSMVAGSTEEEVYHALGSEWIPPEMRENKGEIGLAKKGIVMALVIVVMVVVVMMITRYYYQI